MLPNLTHLVSPPTLAPVTVATFLVKATLLLLVALLVAALLRRASAGARHIVWMGALAALVLLPALSRWMPWRLEIGTSALGAMMHSPEDVRPASHAALDASRGASPTATVDDQRVQRLAPLPETGPLASSLPPSTRPKAPAASTDDPAIARAAHGITAATAWLVLLTLWIAGAGVLLARFVAGLVAVRRIVRGAHALDGADWTVPLWEVADRLDLAHAPRLVQSDAITMPFACGLVHPTIVLPRDADAWTDDRRRAVLFHELAHVRRRDLIGHTLGRITCALYWFHPLAWTAARRLRAESERACDDLVLASGTRASEYADHLLQIVTQVRHAAAPAVALAMARRKEFEGRMLAILDPALERAAPSRLQATGLVIGLAALAVSVSAMAPAGAHGEQQRSVQREGRAASTSDSMATSANALATDTHALESPTKTPATTTHPPAALPPSVAAPHQAMPDTGDRTRRHPRSIGEAVSSAVEQSVVPIIESVTPAVDQALSSVRDGRNEHDVDRDLRDVDVDTNAWENMGESIADAVTRSVGTWTSTKRETHADSGTTALLVQLLRSDSSAKVRRTAAWALGQRDDRSAQAPLAAALEHDKSADVREMAAWGLGQTGDRGAVQALGDAMQRDADEDVKATSAWALGQIGDDAATPALDAAMADPSARVRSRAAWALGQIEPKNAPRGLVAALRDSDTTVRLTAAWALGQIQDPQTLSALSSALASEKDHRVREAEVRAMLLLGQTSDAALKELIKSPDPEIRLRATRALAGYGVGAWPWPWPRPMPRPMP